MAIAVLVPLTFSLKPASALILMGAIYTGAIYGGAYSAILLKTPGTPFKTPSSKPTGLCTDSTCAGHSAPGSSRS